MDDKQTLTEIHRLLPEIEETKAKLKVIRANLKDVLEQNDEYKAMQTEISELVTKRAEGRKLLLSDRDYQKLNAEIEDYRFKLRDLEEILSHHLLEHYNRTQKAEVVDSSGNARPMIISAKIGAGENTSS